MNNAKQKRILKKELQSLKEQREMLNIKIRLVRNLLKEAENK